jgi:uncharacterized protein YeaO (DUF488 family)
MKPRLDLPSLKTQIEEFTASIDADLKKRDGETKTVNYDQLRESLHHIRLDIKAWGDHYLEEMNATAGKTCFELYEHLLKLSLHVGTLGYADDSKTRNFYILKIQHGLYVSANYIAAIQSGRPLARQRSSRILSLR